VNNLYISLGSNIEPVHYVRAGVRALQAHFRCVRLSSVYESKAVGFSGANFLNLVAHVQSDLEIPQVQRLLKNIEQAHGRAADAVKFSSRTLDLDLLLYEDVVQSETGPWQPQLPRAEVLYNAFVLWPLAELAPNLQHPKAAQSMAKLWQRWVEQADPDWQAHIWPLRFDWSYGS
jgi:2-amino-4-hydroxy-6-hydroxymethyldihydropteridine diphosphokinase